MRKPGQRFTRLDARVTQEEGAFTVRILLRHHLNQRDLGGGQELAPSIEAASTMIEGVAKRFKISESNISLAIHMENYKEGTWH